MKSAGSEFSTVEVFLALPSLIPVSNLNLIRSLDLTIFLHREYQPCITPLEQNPRLEVKVSQNIYHQVLAALSPPHFPNFCELRLGLRTWLISPKRPLPASETHAIRIAWLEPLSHFIQSRRVSTQDGTPATQITVAFPPDYFEIFVDDMLRENSIVGDSEYLQRSDLERKVVEGMSAEDFRTMLQAAREKAYRDWERAAGITIVRGPEDSDGVLTWAGCTCLGW